MCNTGRGSKAHGLETVCRRNKFRSRFGSKIPAPGFFELELKRFSFCDYENDADSASLSRPTERRKKYGWRDKLLRGRHASREASRIKPCCGDSIPQQGLLIKLKIVAFSSCNTQAAWLYCHCYENKPANSRVFCGDWPQGWQSHFGSQSASRP